MCSVQLIFSILRHTFISKASNLVMSSLFLHSTRSHFKSVFSPYFSSGIFILLNPPLGNSFLLEKASFPLLSRVVNPGAEGHDPPDFGQGGRREGRRGVVGVVDGS